MKLTLKSPKGKPIPLVLIEWLDSSQPISTWRHLEDIGPATAVPIASVGWLIEDGAEVKVLAPNVGERKNRHNIQACGTITIPVCSIRRIVRLRAGRKF